MTASKCHIVSGAENRGDGITVCDRDVQEYLAEVNNAAREHYQVGISCASSTTISTSLVDCVAYAMIVLHSWYETSVRLQACRNVVQGRL